MKENNLLVKLENAGVYKSSKWLVKGISFEVNKGQIVTLIGPNGSGKTTTAKMILNILNADEGLVTSNTNKMAYVPQKINIDWTMPLRVIDFMKITSSINNTQITETYSIKISQILSINESSLPHDFYLGTNFPNPFNSRTKINFSLDRDLKIKLEIKNLKGQLTRSLLYGKYQKGTHNIIWDGKDDSNRPVVSGIYIYTLIVNEKSTTKKMLYLK